MIKEGQLVKERYQVRQYLTDGGLSSIFLGYDLLKQRQVILKVIKDLYINHPDVKKFFQNEAENIAKINHPSLVKIYDYFEDQHSLIIVEEYVKSLTARKYLELYGPLKIKEAILYLRQLLEVVDYLILNNCLHCDLKTENFFINPNGSITLVDFSLARVTNYKRTNLKPFGTTLYLAPEVLLGDNNHEQSEIYALGVIFFELLVGNPFYDKEDSDKLLKLHQKQNLKDEIRRHSLPRLVQRIISKSTYFKYQHGVFNIKHRYPSIKAFLADLSKIKS